MNLSDFIDKLIDLEIEINAGEPNKVDLPVYAINSSTDVSHLVLGASVEINDRSTQGELLNLKKNLCYVGVYID